jgi:tRNA threonylcarbamoyl adenosine modification protein (Sua5/YciO/YrdC/YwlC family)
MVVAIPTDTVYGLAVDPSQPGAVDRVFALKERPGEVALPVLVTGWGQVEMVAGTLEGAAQGFADQYWPGPLTLVVPRRGRFRADLGGELAASWTVGLRWPDHPVVQALCTAIGPLAVTSANRHAEPPATSAEDVIVAFTGDDRLSAVLDGGVCDGAPSTVVECRGPVSRCLREGAIRWDGSTRRPEALD